MMMANFGETSLPVIQPEQDFDFFYSDTTELQVILIKIIIEECNLGLQKKKKFFWHPAAVEPGNWSQY